MSTTLSPEKREKQLKALGQRHKELQEKCGKHSKHDPNNDAEFHKLRSVGDCWYKYAKHGKYNRFVNQVMRCRFCGFTETFRKEDNDRKPQPHEPAKWKVGEYNGWSE